MRAAVVLALLGGLLAACGSDGPVREPAKLSGIDSPDFKPRILWSRSPGSGGGRLHTGLRLAVEPDVLVTADISGDVYALEPATGKRLWKAATGARVISGPSVSGDLVLLGTQDAEVIALKRSDGSLVWKAKVSSEVLAPPVGSGNIVIARCGDGKIFGLSVGGGARLWSFDRSVPPLVLRGMSAPAIDGNAVFAGLDNGRAVGLKLDSGELLWEQVVSAASGRSELERIVDVDADLLVANDGVFAVSFGGELAAVSVVDGRVAWRRPIKSYSGIALEGRRLAVTADDGVVWMLDGGTGAASWNSEALKYRGLSAPIIVRGRVVVADQDGYVHWMAEDDGRIVARAHAVGGPVRAPMVLKNDVLYVLDTSGEIAAIDTRSE